MIRPCARSRAWRECIIHRLVTLGFSCDESCADSVLSVVNVPAGRRSLLHEINLQVHGFVTLHTLRVGQALSARPASPLPQQEGLTTFCAVVINEVLCRVLILGSSSRDFCRCHSPNVHLRVFASRILCLWRHVQCHRFSCSLGRCGRPGMSFQSRSAHIVFCCCLLESV